MLQRELSIVFLRVKSTFSPELAVALMPSLEDSLDAMKTVVRKKLGLSGSAPVFLSQWREGKAVDLEDDDDFEAFSAAARSSSSVVVKVILGESQTRTLPSADENETPSITKTKRKRKSRHSVTPPVTERPPEESITPDSGPELVPAKKRRVSFAADAPELGQIMEEKLKKKGKEKSASPPRDITEHEQSEKEGESGKKKKRKKNKRKDKEGENLEEDNTKATAEKLAVGHESGKKTTADSTISKIPSNDVALAAVTEFGQPTPQPKKSKKRSRSGDAQDESIPTQQPVPTSAADEHERPTKKAKKKKATEIGAADIPITDVTVDTTTITKTTSETVSSTVHPSANNGAEEAKKQRKKKEKVTADLEDNSISETVDPGIVSKNPDDAVSEKPKKSAKSKSANIAPSSAAAELTRTDEPLPTSNSITATSAPAADVSDKAPVTKKSKKKDKEKTAATKQTETALDTTDTLSRPDTSMSTVTHLHDCYVDSNIRAQAESKKNKDTETDSENSATAVTKDGVESSEVTNAKSTKKTGKQKKTETINTEQTSSTKGQSTEQANAAIETAAVMKEATRLAVENVLKKAAEKAASSSSGQANATYSPTATTDVTSAANHPTKAPSSSESSKSIEKSRVSLAKSAKESDTCPICETSPFHARSRCPVIKSGIRAMRKKVAELEQDTSKDGADSRASIILELQNIIDRRTKKPRAPDAQKPGGTEAESESPGKESEVVATVDVTCPVPTSVPEPSIEAEAAPTAVVPPASVPRISGTPSGKPISAREILNQKAQQTLSSRASSSQKPVASVPTVLPAMSKPTHIAEVALSMELSRFGDMSQFTDKDLDALIRGPRLSMKNALPTSDTEDESEQEEEDVVLEEDVTVEDRAARNASRVEYPSSSDEAEDEEEDEIPSGGPSNVDHPSTAAIIEEAEEDEEEAKDAEKSQGNLSFHDINALGSSVEPDRTGNNAVHAAVGADLASINEPEASKSNGAKDSDNDSDKSDSDSEDSSPSGPKVSPENVIEDEDADPIEPSDPPTSTQPRPVEDLISSGEEDVPLSQSTPKSEVVGRTRSQRTTAAIKRSTITSQPPESQSKDPASKDAPVEETPKPRTRGMKKLTELPVPPNPAVRVIRQAAVATPKTRRQLAQEKQREETPEESEVTVRTRSAAAAAAKAKVPAKAPPKTPAKTPARAKTTAKPLSKQGKSTVSNAVPTNQDHGPTPIPPSSPGKRAAGSSWAVLQENVHSQVDTDNGGQVDELLSSPTIEPRTTRDPGGKGENSMSVNGSQQDPLFIPAESQQSFPYSQYPLDVPHTSQAIASPNDSDDENEVALAVVKTSSAPQKQAYRSLTDIASQSKLFAPRPSQILKQITEPQDEDLFGRNGQESEESDSGSDSDDDNKKRISSHIPATRRAGVAVPKKK
uniref:Uncharacterized protein n=1 Tax=Psilocybe cubensis TaxID=181762 RepID=A0A8H7Y430_PSICU